MPLLLTLLHSLVVIKIKSTSLKQDMYLAYVTNCDIKANTRYTGISSPGGEEHDILLIGTSLYYDVDRLNRPNADKRSKIPCYYIYRAAG